MWWANERLPWRAPPSTQRAVLGHARGLAGGIVGTPFRELMHETKSSRESATHRELNGVVLHAFLFEGGDSGWAGGCHGMAWPWMHALAKTEASRRRETAMRCGRLAAAASMTRHSSPPVKVRLPDRKRDSIIRRPVDRCG